MRRGQRPELDAISLRSTIGASSLVDTSAPVWKTTSSSIRIVSLRATPSWLRAWPGCAPVLGDIQQALRKHVKSCNCRQDKSGRRKRGDNAVTVIVRRLRDFDRHNRFRKCDWHDDRMV